MKYCEEFAALLDPYVDGELTGEEAARVRAHLADCPGCRRYVDDALAVRAAFPEAEETAVPEGFAESVMAAVRESEAAGNRTGGRRRMYWRKVLLPLAACFALVVLLRTIPGAGNDAPAAAPAAMDAAVSRGAAESEAEAYEYGAAAAPAAPYSLAAAPQAADSEASPEEAGGAAPKEEGGAGSSRILMAPTTALQDGPAAGNGTAETPVPQPEPAAAAGGGRVIRLTAAQAGELLAELPYTVEADGARCYQLPGGDFDALLETLAERGISPAQEAAEDFPEGYDLVYVTEE